MATETTSGASEERKIGTIEEETELAERAFALKQYERAVQHYGAALELMTVKFGDGAPETADLLFLYGKTLLESAIAQSDVFGKDNQEEDAEGQAGSSSSTNPNFHFGGEADLEEMAAEDGEENTVDLFAEAEAAVEKEDAEETNDQQEEEEDEEAPEDDFNAAWEVLDLARAIYEKAESNEGKLKLADTYICLGDVSLETEKFPQAITDYENALKLKTELLPFSSRQLAEVHYKLSIVLDLAPGKLGEAITHVERARDSLRARLEVLRKGLATREAGGGAEVLKDNGKGKEKATYSNGRINLPKEDVDKLSLDQIKAELAEVEELQADLNLKVEDLVAMNEQQVAEEHIPAPDLVNRELDAALNHTIGKQSAVPQPVHDLTSMVKKKKKPQAGGGVAWGKAGDGSTLNASDTSTASLKRKADGDEVGGTEKKSRTE